MAQIDNLAIEITANTSKAVADIQKLASALSALKNASKGISGANISKVATAMSELKYACSGISQSAINRVNNLADALERIASLDADNISKIVTAMNRIKKMPNVGATPKATASTTPFQAPALVTPFQPPERVFNAPSTNVWGVEFRQAIEQNADAFTQATSVMATAGSAFYGEWREISEEVPKGASKTSMAMSDFIYKLQMLKAYAEVNGLKDIKIGFSSIGDTVKKVLSPLSKFLKALGRIALYRAIRGLLKNITQGLKEGIENLAIYSKSINELDSAKANYTMSQLATSFLYLKNSVASAVMPIIQQFTPAIQRMVEVCVKALNIINQLISALQGKATFTKAKVVWVDYADSLDKANKSAKALHHQLAGFDELNNLTAPSGSGSALDPSTMFEEAFIDSKILDIAEKIKEKFDDVLRIVGAIGAGILAWTIGSKLADALTTLGLLSKGQGLQLALGLTLMVAGFTLEGTSIIDIIKNGLNLDNFGTAVGGALMASLGSFLTGNVFASFFGASFLTGVIGGIGTAVAGIGLFVAGVWDSIVNGIDWLSAILTAIGGALTGAGIGAIIGALGGPIGAGMGALIGLAVGALVNLVIAVVQHWDEIKQAVSNAWDKIKTFFTEQLPYAVGYAVGWLYKNVPNAVLKINNHISTLVDKTKDTLTKVTNKFKEWHTNLKRWIETTIPKIPSMIQDFFTSLPMRIFAHLINAKLKFEQWKNDMVTWVQTEVPKIRDGILNIFSEDFLSKVYDIGKDFLSNLWQGILDNSYDFISNIFGFFSDIFKKIADNFDKGFDAGIGKQTAPDLPMYANGGYVPRGNLFIANERGAEMVGSINGNTAVANNDQITSAIAMATYNAMSKALSENNGSVNIVVEGDADRMFKVFHKKEREYQKTGYAY